MCGEFSSYNPYLLKPSGKDGAVNAIVLYKELESNPNSVLIMDVRRSDHFKDSHMTIGQCISIPAEILTPG